MIHEDKTVLPSELASLIHHVELSKAGWRDEAFRILLLSIIGRHRSAMSIDSICGLVNQLIPAPVSRPQVEHVVHTLVSQQQLLQLPGEQYRLSEQAQVAYTNRVDDDLSLTANVEQAFAEAFGVLVDDDVVSWSRFLDEFLMPLVSDLGARTYELVTGDQSRIQDVPAYQRFIAGLDETYRAAACDSLAVFLDSGDTETRQYILRLLNNSFLAQAIALPEAAMKALLDRIRKPLRIRVFLDTNFLLSLLDLHEHPANEVVLALHDVVHRMPGRVNVKFYVLPFTVDEMQKTLEHHAVSLGNFYMDRKMARAIDYSSGKVSGILRAYARNAYSSSGRISAKDYLDPYLYDFNQVAREKGVELYNRDLEHLSTDDNVIADVEEQIEIHERTKRKERRKSYEKMLHDMKLWHFVRRERPARVGSPLDAEAWVATLDFGLIRFDRSKRRPHEPAVCIHPTSLLHVLQLWVPSTDLLTSALMESLRPMMPRVLDYDAEEISIRIVEVLSRFESEDLSDDTVSHILLSQAVRERIGSANSREEEVEIIQSEVAKANKNLAEQVVEHKRVVDAERRRAKELERTLQEERRRRQTAELSKDEVMKHLVDERYEREKMESRVKELELSVKEREKAARHKARRRAWRLAMARASVLGMATLGMLTWGTRILFQSRGDATWLEVVGVWTIVVVTGTGVGLEVLRRSADRVALPSDGRWVRRVNAASSRVRYLWWTLVVGIVVTSVASLVSR